VVAGIGDGIDVGVRMDQCSGAGVVTGLRVAEVCSIWGVQVEVFMLGFQVGGWSSQRVQVGGKHQVQFLQTAV
jgi:hypothetical protein